MEGGARWAGDLARSAEAAARERGAARDRAPAGRRRRRPLGHPAGGPEERRFQLPGRQAGGVRESAAEARGQRDRHGDADPAAGNPDERDRRLPRDARPRCADERGGHPVRARPHGAGQVRRLHQPAGEGRSGVQGDRRADRRSDAGEAAQHPTARSGAAEDRRGALRGAHGGLHRGAAAARGRRQGSGRGDVRHAEKAPGLAPARRGRARSTGWAIG